MVECAAIQKGFKEQGGKTCTKYNKHNHCKGIGLHRISKDKKERAVKKLLGREMPVTMPFPEERDITAKLKEVNSAVMFIARQLVHRSKPLKM